MKYLKTYEDLNKGEIEVGDYVITNFDVYQEGDLNDVKNHLIAKVYNAKESDYSTHIEYLLVYNTKDFLFQDRIAVNQRKATWECLAYDYNIKYWSKDKNELIEILELLSNTNKYNL